MNEFVKELVPSESIKEEKRGSRNMYSAIPEKSILNTGRILGNMVHEYFYSV